MSKNNVCLLIAGHTLVELLIAFMLSSTLTLIAIQYYALAKRLSQSVTIRATELEEERYVFYFILNYLTQPGIQIKNPQSYFDYLQLKANSDVVATNKAFFYVSTTHHHRYPPALFFKEGGKPRVELATAVSHMRIEYGIKCKDSNNICQYVTSQSNVTWENIVSLKIELKRAQSSWQSKMQQIYVAIKPR
jgi:hypothetical protein